ncbi:MAG: nicotinamide-nucleotide amidohydrolase family protein [Clostridiales bacterium]|nr:nicotinamide-nucleotide amidohydrolase family protein [Clostridiales bacterium]
MKSALIFFRNLTSNFDGEYYQSVINCFSIGGLKADTVEILSHTDDLGFTRRLAEFKDMFENIVIIGGDSVAFDLKSIIAQSFDTTFVENENAKTFLDAVSKEKNVVYPESYASLPIESSVIPNINGGYQGFIMDSNELTLSVLPFDLKEVKVMCDKYVLPYLENKLGIKKTRLTLKYFGDLTVLNDILQKAEKIRENSFTWTVNEKYGDAQVDLTFPYETDEQIKKDIVRFIVSNLRENIYAEYDVGLGERLFDLLRLRKVKLSLAESFTGGRVVAEIIKNSGASAYVNEGLVPYSNQSKIKRLGVQSKDLASQGAVSAVVAYQMALGLLKEGNCDMAICTTGIAGPNSDDTDKPVGLCYIAVGMKDGIHTYRNRLSGTREQITETAKNTALFLAIKKLKTL